jgi:hypothetical protein
MAGEVSERAASVRPACAGGRRGRPPARPVAGNHLLPLMLYVFLLCGRLFLTTTWHTIT